MKSYKKTYFLQSILELPNILLMVSLTLCPPMFVACLFDNYGLIKSFLMILVFPIVLSIVYLIIYLPMLLINLIIWIFITEGKKCGNQRVYCSTKTSYGIWS